MTLRAVRYWLMGAPTQPRTHVDAGYRAWRVVWSAALALATRSRRVLTTLAFLGIPSYRNEIVTLALVGHKTGISRPVTVAMISLDGRRYVGSANGKTPWLTNLAAMETVTLTFARDRPVVVRPTLLELGPERDAVIRATASRGPIHVRPMYWASRRHVIRAGVFCRLDPN